MILETVRLLPGVSIFYAVLAGLFLQVSICAHLIGTGTLTVLIDRAGLAEDYAFLREMSPAARARALSLRAPAAVLGVVVLAISIVVAVLELNAR